MTRFPFHELYQEATETYPNKDRELFMKEVWSQISFSTKMACALNWRNDSSVHEGDHKMMVNFSTRMPLGKNGHWHIIVILEPNDTYTVKLVKFRNKPLKNQTNLMHVEEERENVYCDEVSDVIYWMCNQ